MKLVIVRDMWLTGFDAPCMHTMYIDKPMQGHGLMQAIARVNRVFRDKPAGLIVDYIGIAQNLKTALGQYSRPDQRAGRHRRSRGRRRDAGEVRDRRECSPDTTGFDYRRAWRARRRSAWSSMAGAIDWVLAMQQRGGRARRPPKKARSGRTGAIGDAVLALSKAFALAAASDEARDIRDEVGFFQAIRAALVKSTPTEPA